MIKKEHKQLGKNYWCECGAMIMDWEYIKSTNYCGNCGQRLKEYGGAE